MACLIVYNDNCSNNYRIAKDSQPPTTPRLDKDKNLYYTFLVRDKIPGISTPFTFSYFLLQCP